MFFSSDIKKTTIAQKMHITDCKIIVAGLVLMVHVSMFMKFIFKTYFEYIVILFLFNKICMYTTKFSFNFIIHQLFKS